MALIIAHLRDEEKCRHGGDAVSNYIMLAAHQAQMAVSCFGERGAGIFSPIYVRAATLPGAL
jgi:hypothetical protein